MLFHSKTRSALFTYHAVCAAALAAALAIAPAAHAISLYWDADGNLGGSGTWDINTTQNWSTTNAVGPPDSTWTPNDGTLDAEFNGSAGYTVTIPGGTTINVNSVSMGVSAGNVFIKGGTALNITDPNNSIIMNTGFTGSIRGQIIESPISGTDITVVADWTGTDTARPRVDLGENLQTGASPNTFTGDLIIAGSGPGNPPNLAQVGINNPVSLPASATVRMRRNNTQLLFTGGGAAGGTPIVATYNNDIILNDGITTATTATQGIGSITLGTMATLGGVISGNANLVFEAGAGGGNGMIILANNATYTGFTTLSSQTNGVVRLAIDDALPVGTRFNINRGRFDMAGFDQRVGGLNSTAAGNGFVTNTGGTTSTLTIDGDETGNYAGIIGASLLAGSNDNVALALASTNTGTLTLSNNTLFGNTYTGGTTINGGRLLAANDIVTNPFSSATGTGPVAVNNGGTLGGTGGVGGAVTVGSGGHIAPGTSGGNAIGTLTAFDAVSLDSGSRLDIDLGSPAPGGGASDRVDLSGTFGSFALTVPAAASSIGVDLSDPAGGAAGNGTYTLVTFQAGQYTNSSDASQFFTSSLPSPNSLNGATIAYHLADGSNTIQDGNPNAATRVIMSVTGGPNALLWTGSVNGNWNVGSTANFTNAATGAGSTFAGNDNVTFDDNGSNTNPVTITGGGVQPNIVTVNNSSTAYTFSGGDINGSSLGGGGGLFLSGTGAATFNSNYTAEGPITSNKSGSGNAIFNGNITDATSVTVNGGAFKLAGANTYAGNTTVNGGTLVIEGSSATVGQGDLTVNGGSAVISAGVLNAILDTATLTLAGGGVTDTPDVAFIDLGAGVNELVGSLVLGTTLFTSGTFGATGSGALNIMDEYFSGTGLITVLANLPGDYNDDGAVDAADYVIWRKNPGAFGGDPDGYNDWRANFGATAGSGAALPAADSLSTAVPEPASIVLSMLPLVSMFFGRRKARHRVTQA